jgi:hypothetical protein
LTPLTYEGVKSKNRIFGKFFKKWTCIYYGICLNLYIMKTFGLYMIIWLVCISISFNICKAVSTQEMLEMILATQLAFIFYKLLKEEEGNK